MALVVTPEGMRMANWRDGYVAEVTYSHHYCREMNPQRLRFALASAGLHCPAIAQACELGFGWGAGTNLHAAASATTWHGTDFNPSHAGLAQELAGRSGAAAHLADQSFAQFCARGDLPDFDYIALHGVWSWVSEANRALIVEFIGRKLKPGGVVFISYNTQPGWASMLPLRDLMFAHSTMLTAPGRPMGQRIDDALAFGQHLVETSPRFAAAHPGLAQRLAQLQTFDRDYLAHEYFNDNWEPMSFLAVAQLLAPAKLDFACSANGFDHVPGIDLSAEQQSTLDALPDPLFRQGARDLMVDQQFRRDYWIKGARRLTAHEQLAALRGTVVMLVKHRPNVPVSIDIARGAASLNQAIYAPVLDVLADHRAQSLAAIESAVAGAGVRIELVREVVLILAALGHLVFVQDDAAIAHARPQCARLNDALLERARTRDDMHFLASPVSGEGFSVGRIEQLFLLALREGRAQAADLASFAWHILEGQGQQFVREGTALESVEDKLAHLTSMGASFLATRLPVLRELLIA